MDITAAVELVTTIESEHDDFESVEEVIAHVTNTLRLPEEPPVPGGYPLEEDGSDAARAYRLILETFATLTPAQIAAHASQSFREAFSASFHEARTWPEVSEL